MALRHGVGLPVRAWRCAWGPHATANPPAGGGLPCPSSSFIQPDADPWLRLNPPDPDHLVNRNTIPTALWAPYLGLAADRRCWLGGAGGVAPHDATSAGLLVAAFLASKLGSPADWTGIPNEQEIYLLSVSGEAHEYVRARAGVPQPPAPPPPPPPVEPPPQPPGAPQPSDELERRVAELEEGVAVHQTELDDLTRNLANVVEIWGRRVSALENREHALTDRVLALEAKAHVHGTPAPPAPPQPPAPQPGSPEPAFTWKLDTPWTSTAAQPHRLLKVPFAGLARRITLSYRVDIPEVAAGQRQQVHAAYVDGSGRSGILSLLFVDGGRRSWVLRTNSAGASQPWVTATKAGLRPEESNAYAVRQDWTAGDNRVVAGSAGETSDRPAQPLRMQQGLFIDLGYNRDSVEGNPAEAYSLGWTWSDLEVKIWE